MAVSDRILNRPARRSGPTTVAFFVLLVTLLLAACLTTPPATAPTDRTDDIIIVAGQPFHTGTRVVTWKEKDGYNAYQFTVTKHSGNANHGARRLPSPSVDGDWIDRAAPWDLPALQTYVDQFVFHYDGEGFSRRCFDILQRRGLSAHFLLDLDGTIYQTLDLRERAFHATESNSRSIGIEIANIGAFAPDKNKELTAWYQRDGEGNPVVTIPKELGDPHFLRPEFTARPIQPNLIEGKINGRVVRQYDFTPEQYAALIKLTAAIHRVFPLIKLDQPRDSEDQPIREKLTEESLLKYQGLLGHYHIQTNKVDPGPAFDWERVIDGAQQN